MITVSDLLAVVADSKDSLSLSPLATNQHACCNFTLYEADVVEYTAATHTHGNIHLT